MSELFILGSSPVIPHERLDGSPSLNHPDILSGELLVPIFSRDVGLSCDAHFSVTKTGLQK